MAMGVLPRCNAQYTGLATRPRGHLHVSLMCQFAANARGDRRRGVRHRCRRGTIVGTGVGAGAGTGVGDGAGAGAGGTGSRAGAATLGTGVGIGTYVFSGGAVVEFSTAVAGEINDAASGWCHVTSRDITTFPVSASSSLWQSCP